MGIPSLAAHKALMAHDQAHGEPPAKLGAHFHWLRSWVVQRGRQWHSVDWLICGGNPLLGALAAAAAARRGRTALWLGSDAFDAWDYPLAMGGAHDDLLEKAGLPGAGAGLFKTLAKECEGKLALGWGWTAEYCAPSGEAGKSLSFLTQAGSRPQGGARELAKALARDAFSEVPALRAKKLPRRIGKGLRAQVVEHSCAVWISDRQDGAAREQWGERRGSALEEGQEMRVGRARWHSQNAEQFALQSRMDVELLLRLGGWP